MAEMENEIKLDPIGEVHVENGVFSIQVKEKYRDGLTNIHGFSHLGDKPEYRNHLINEKPYKAGPEKVGVFATRSEFRPNPVLITTIFVDEIDMDNGIIKTPYIDAEHGTPVLDIKPYHRIERVEDCRVPQWCEHWPSSYEKAAAFDWENEFNF